MMRYGSIYIATNNYTGEQYVGQTRQSVQKRWAAHWRTATCQKTRKAKFQNALIEFGQLAFKVEEVFTAFDAAALNAAEIELIISLTPAYNATKGGKGLRSFVTSEAVKVKRSIDAKARWENPTWRANTIVSLKNSHTSEKALSHARQLAKMRIGTKASNETRAKISAASKTKNQLIVSENTEKTRLIHAKCVLGANVDIVCLEHGLSRQTFYKYVKRLQLPLFGQKPRGVYCDV